MRARTPKIADVEDDLVENPTIGIHWLTAVTSEQEDAVVDLLGAGAWGRPEVRGGMGNPLQRVHESGAKLYYGSDMETQPRVLVLDGTTCESWSGEALGWIEKLKGRITRADVCIDVGPEAMSTSRLWSMRNAYEAGKCKTAFKRKLVFHEDQNDGQGNTLELGGRESGAFFRAYDRRGPLRLEWEIKPQNKDLGARLPAMLRDNLAGVWRTCAERVVFPHKWYQALMKGDRVDFGQDLRPTLLLGETLKQLEKQWGPTFAALELLGFKLSDLARPDALKDLRGSDKAKFKAWSREADKLGYNGKKLRESIK